MIAAKRSINETCRLKALRQYGVLDTLPEQELDDITTLAAQICGAPMATLSLVDENRQWFKAQIGMEVSETERDISFCGYVVQRRELFIVPDASLDDRFWDNPLVTGEPHIRFYAGAPLITPEGDVIGSLCVMDRLPRELTQVQKQALQIFSRQVMTHLELRRHAQKLVESVTARKQVEVASRRLAAIVECSHDAIIGLDLDGIITSWNKGAEKLFGYTTEEMTGHSIQKLIPLERHGEERLLQKKIRSIAGVQHFETQRLTKDGRLVDVSLTASPIKDGDGNIIGVSKIARDISDGKRAEEALRLDGAIMENIAAGIYLVRARDGIIIHTNPNFEILFGYAPGEILNQHVSTLNAQTQHSPREVAEQIMACLKRDGKWQGEIYSKRKDGSCFWSYCNIRTFEHATHGTVWIAARQDITERRRAIEKIAEQAAFLDKARDAILARDLEGNILFWNQGAERMYGWKDEEVVGQYVGNLLYNDPKKFEEINRQTINEGEWTGELQHRTKDRGEITVEAHWTLIRDDAGNPKSVLAINTDITEKRKIEAQFMRAQRMESIGTLAGGVAHDLNNILAPIMMSIDILKQTAENPHTKEILDTIEVSAKRGSDIVRQVLSFARGLEGERIEVQPKHLLKDLAIIVKDTFPKDIRLQFSVPNDTWTILGDPTQIHQILLNLCVNARDAMPNGGTLTIAIENCTLDEQYAAMNIQAKPGRYLNISVTDTGTGIPLHLVDKIFEPFFTTKALSKGTGLGLSTVMAIVKSHDGIINVYSEPGRGTTFKVYLPAVDILDAGRREQAESISWPRGEGETILVVDDENSILNITRQTLQAFGYKVLTATDGADAVATYAQNRDKIAVVLTDMMMPVMDGPATVHALTRLNPLIKIIAASGLGANGSGSSASAFGMAEMGVKHFLTKPYTAGTLLKTLRAILDGSDLEPGIRERRLKKITPKSRSITRAK